MGISEHAKRLFSLQALPGWALAIWKVIETVDTVSFVVSTVNSVWSFLTSPTGDLVVLIIGFSLLILAVLRPRWYLTRRPHPVPKQTLGGVRDELLNDIGSLNNRLNNVELHLSDIGMRLSPIPTAASLEDFLAASTATKEQLQDMAQRVAELQRKVNRLWDCIDPNDLDIGAGR